MGSGSTLRFPRKASWLNPWLGAYANNRLSRVRYERHEPVFAEHPGYGIWPCDSEWHRTRPKNHDGEKCPTCGNNWWAVDGSECREEYALLTEIDHLRELVAGVPHGDES